MEAPPSVEKQVFLFLAWRTLREGWTQAHSTVSTELEGGPPVAKEQPIKQLNKTGPSTVKNKAGLHKLGLKECQGWMRQAGSGPSSTWQLQLAAMETLGSESHWGRATGKGAEKEEGKAREVANEYAVKMLHMAPKTD